MTTPFRYPGAQPFNTEQTHIFKGRQENTAALLQRIYLGQLIVLYARSGLGKSSLLNAGIIPKVRESGKLEPLNIRFGAYSEDSAHTPLDTCRSALKSKAALLDKIRPGEDDSLWYQLKSRQLTGTAPQDFLLIFDQFEELFTYPEAQVMAFAQQLSELFYTTIPSRYREKIEHLLSENSSFFRPEELQQLHQPFTVKAVVAIRFDRMALLDRLKPYLPNILDDTYELAPLTYQQAEDAILLPAFDQAAFASPVFDYEDQAVEGLLQFLSKGGAQPIESFQLQILCEYAEKQIVIRQNRRLITAADLTEPERILENYYLDKIAEIPDEADQLAARKFIEEGLIFEEEERRLSLYEGQIYRTYRISPTLLRQLLDTHLIRSEPSMQGGYTYELSHDTLVLPVLKAKRIRIQAEKQAAERLAREELERERKKRQRANFVAGLSILLALLATSTSVYAFYLRNDALAARELAKGKEAEALAAKTTAETNLMKLQREKALAYLRDGDGFVQNDECAYALDKYQQALEILPADEQELRQEILQNMSKCRSLITSQQ